MWRLVVVPLLALTLVLTQLMVGQTTAAAPAPVEQTSGSTPPPVKQASEKCSIAGTVLRASDGQPLKKVVITVLPQQAQPNATRPSTMSDSEGKFLLKNIEPGRYTLSAWRTGYVRQNYGARTPNSPGTTLTLVAGQQVDKIVFRMLPGAAISGRIVDEDSEPVANVRVQVLRWVYTNGARRLMPASGATTDDRGEYRVHSLAPGRYLLSATYSTMNAGMPGTRLAGEIASEGYAPTYYPGTNDVAQAAVLEVQAASDMPGINLRLLPSHAVRVSGTVVSGTGEAARGVTLNLWSRQAGMMFGGPTNFARVDAQGAFEIGQVMPGSYSLLAYSFDNGKRVETRVDLDVGNNDVEGITIVLRPGVELQGQVHVDGAADLGSSQLRMGLMPLEISPLGGGGSAQVKADLSFVMSDLSDGNYMLRLTGLPEDFYMSSARMGKVDVLQDGLLIRGRGDQLDITVSAAGGRVEGSVVDGKNQPYTGARVVLVPEGSLRKRSDLYKVTSSDQYGHFVMRGITPGKYKLFAWETIEEGAYQDPDFLRSNDDLGQALDVSSASRLTPEVKLIPVEKSGS